jgi:hypothetical protein
MPTETVELRQAVATAVDALSGWTQSRFPAELFGRDTNSLQHHAFAVHLPDTVPHAREGRQRASEGMWSESAVEVLWAHRIRNDAAVADYDAALEAEQDLAAAVKAIADQYMMVERLSRRTVAPGWLLGTARFRVQHRYSLS